MSIELTKKQQEGLQIAVDRYKTGEKYTTIAGFAGTGKTFLAKRIIDELGLGQYEYMVGAFTGKAAYRLNQGGFDSATTLHKIRYKSVKIKDTFVNMKHPREAYQGIKLFLIDEISMVSNKLLTDMAGLGIHIIMMGDPGQLPPIGEDNKMLASPHIFLDEIMRQEEGNSIIQLSHQIRTGQQIKLFQDENVILLPKEDVNTGMLTWADQIICGKNATRKVFNQTVRNEKGFISTLPVVGDKVIITANNWDMLNDAGSPLINGMMGEVNYSSDIFVKDERMGRSMGKDIKIARLAFEPEFGGGDFSIKYDALPLMTDDGSKSYIVNQFAKGAARINHLDFGYCITTHKAQGSEYGKVLGIEEVLKRNEHRRWLYTLATRAVDKLVIGVDLNSGIWEK